MSVKQGGAEWLDIESPSEAEINNLGKKYKLHPVILDELKNPSARSRVENHGSYLYMIYYFPVYNEKERVSRRSEIDLIITKSEVITVHYEHIQILEELKNNLGEKDVVFNNAVSLTHKIIGTLLNFQQRQLSHIQQKLEKVSLELFKDRERQREKDLLERISYIKRDISEYRLVVRPQRNILESFLHTGCDFLGDTCVIYTNDLIGEQLKTMDQLDDYRQAIEDFESTNNQLINIKNTQVVKTFTILAFLTFPMMLFAALFGMNTKDTPLVDHPYGFWIILSIMIATMAGMYVYFRKKDWL